MYIVSEVEGAKLWANVYETDILLASRESAHIEVRFFDERPFLISLDRSGLDWHMDLDSLLELQEVLALKLISPLYVMDLLEQLADRLWCRLIEPALEQSYEPKI